MNKLKLSFIRARLKFFPSRAKKYDFNLILEASGIKVGKGTVFFAPKTVVIDRGWPHLLSIGEYCKITAGVTILTHDYSRSVLRRAYGEVIGEGRKTTIGNNVFIGMNSTILMGATIGDNVIIGAGSVVSGTIPNNVVVAGNPARIIRSLEDHYSIWKGKMLTEAKEFVLAYFDYYKKKPTVDVMNRVTAFWPLYLPRTKEALLESGANWHLSGDDPDEIMHDFICSTPPPFGSYDEFLNYCFEGEKNS